jgi:uncharacterized protein (DUF427 family)
MSTLVRRSVLSGLRGLRHEPTAKRIRAKLGEHTVVDSTRAVLLWEPRRIVPSWEVPIEDVAAELTSATPADGAADDVGHSAPAWSERPVLDPSIPFATHTTEGDVVDVVSEHGARVAAGLRLSDPDLDGYVLLDFHAFDSCWDEDEQNIGHPRDPFHRIDILRSSRHVRVELDGELLAESTRPQLLFETMLPVRFYLPREDVHADLVASETRTICAYKGHASYFSPVVGGREIPDLVWTYETPQREAAEIAGLVAFFNERVDLVVDGTRHERPITQWSRGAVPATDQATRSARA